MSRPMISNYCSPLASESTHSFLPQPSHSPPIVPIARKEYLMNHLRTRHPPRPRRDFSNQHQPTQKKSLSIPSLCHQKDSALTQSDEHNTQKDVPFPSRSRQARTSARSATNSCRSPRNCYPPRLPEASTPLAAVHRDVSAKLGYTLPLSTRGMSRLADAYRARDCIRFDACRSARGNQSPYWAPPRASTAP